MRRLTIDVRTEIRYGIEHSRLQDAVRIQFSLLDVLCTAFAEDPENVSDWAWDSAVRSAVAGRRPLPREEGKNFVYSRPDGQWDKELVRRATMYGLLASTLIAESSGSHYSGMSARDHRRYTEKMSRFMYWMEHTGRLPKTLPITIEDSRT